MRQHEDIELGDDLEGWWQAHAQRELEMLLPKVKHYGAYDLELIGSGLALLIGVPPEKQTIALKQELACFFYLLGKVARMIEAYRSGKIPADDTPFDAAIYAKMIIRIRESGRWP